MSISNGSVFDILSPLREYFQKNSILNSHESEEPFRSELFSTEQMNRHGEIAAKAHKLKVKKSPDQLLARLEENEFILLEVRKLLVESIRLGKTVTPAAEWLLDNFYLLEEQVVIARRHLPKGYSEGLPCLAEGISSGLPRVYDIVLEIISHSDGRVDVKSLISFISAYQKHNVLTLGELWAIPIMLRLAVIENLRRVSRTIAVDMIDRNLSDFWSERMTATVRDEPENLILTIADMVRSKPDLTGPFVASFTRELQGKGPALALPLSWMEQQLSTRGLSSSDLVRQENRKQAANQVSVRNCIGTLRFLGATDWREFVETLSCVEQLLRQDCSGIYPLMDFATRDRYRHVVESIATACRIPESMVAQKALDLAEHNPCLKRRMERQKHVGYYLIDKGLHLTEQACGMTVTLRLRVIRAMKSISVLQYLISLLVVTLTASAVIIYPLRQQGFHHKFIFLLAAFLTFVCCVQFAVSLVNWLSALRIPPSLLPRMDFSKGIPSEYRTIVVIPTMLTERTYIDQLIESLEVRFLANREPHLHFGLLTDFTDADSEVMIDDDVLLDHARISIEALNAKYKDTEYDIFYLFHRPRTWNSRERKWMGYERKRGKLAALNGLLLGKGQDPFSLVIGDCRVLSNIKYVITLDSDTQLPRDAAWKFIASMAHPLNCAVYSEKKRRVVDGYGILQPRVSSGIPEGASSMYMRMQGNVEGIDPYTHVSSDLYQDLFGEGSFIGKGIYDVAVFEQSLSNVFPENRILSHDLLEGCYARSGLISDVYLYEDNPSRYEADMKRRLRWIRGDWQIGAWMLPFISGSGGKLCLNRLSLLSRWKIFDNLRRSMFPMSLLLLFASGCALFPFPLFWLGSAAFMLLFPFALSAAVHLIRKPADLTLYAHLSEIRSSVVGSLFRFVFDLSVLPYEAIAFTDAVLRTQWRMIISHRKLLEWTTSASSRSDDKTFLSTFISMKYAPLTALLCAAAAWHSSFMTACVPVLALWFAAPALAWKISSPSDSDDGYLLPDEISFLHRSARRTWLFFEHFVTEDEHWLPPDNFQEQPTAVIAHRTSPTNMGLSLLSNLAAYDFGYISGGELLQRCGGTLNTMSRLERYHGHFYNWYDTLSLLPLLPRYVSTVDSGNLSGHLLVLRQGLLALPSQPVISASVFDGIGDDAGILNEKKNHRTAVIMKSFYYELGEAGKDAGNLCSHLHHLRALYALSNELSDLSDDSLWAGRLSFQIKKHIDELLYLIPWIDLLPVPESLPGLSSLSAVPSLFDIMQMNLLFPVIDCCEQSENFPETGEWLYRVRRSIAEGISRASERTASVNRCADQCEEMSSAEYDFLFDSSTSLLRIGYNADEQRKDNSFYDLLASESRLGIFTAIAQGKLPQECWFALGRLLTNSGGDPILLSWSGSMFEYLMPQLVMPSYENTLLHQTNRAAVRRQIEYAGLRGIPWGISESAYNMVDAGMNYQYRAFGVPGLGLKRGLEEDLVIAPYASMLALMIMPSKACANLQLLSRESVVGEFGFFESVDFTAARLPRGKSRSIVPSYMVHHQGMSFLSLAYRLLDKPMQKRFLSERRFQAAMLLLQERIPRATLFYAHTADLIESHGAAEDIPVRSITTPDTVTPEIQLLSNGRYLVMITNAGGGYSRWKDIAVTRWREDTTRDDRGVFCYIKDISSGEFWSNTYQPTLHAAKGYEVIFSQGHVEFRRQDNGIHTKTEIVISPEDDVEIRRVRITNRTLSQKVLEITSYAETVIASQSSDEAHPAFSSLFVQTEILPELSAVISTRRPRSEEESPPWVFHHVHLHGAAAEAVSYETDRMRFIGRGNTLVHPLAMDEDELSGSQGSVLDPIMSIRYRVSIRPNQTVTLDMVYGIADTKEDCGNLLSKYRDPHLKNRAFALSWTHSQVLLRQINASEADAQLYNRLAASVIYANAGLRADSPVIMSNMRGQSGLWSHSVSGDIPIVLLHIFDTENMELVKQMIQAHAYWRLKGLAVDLVIWNEDHGSYRQLLQEQILSLISTEAFSSPAYSKPGNIFVKSADQLSSEDRILFESAARVIIYDNRGTLAQQVNRPDVERALPALIERTDTLHEEEHHIALPDSLQFNNGRGGFTRDGREYKIITDGKETTPAPWVNVLANPDFGTVVSESGSGYTWSMNAHEYRITPWSNDPVSDIGGEAFYLRDEESGHFWSPMPFPSNGASPYIITHGFGFSSFEHREQGVMSEVCVFVDKALPVKFIVLKIKNMSGRSRTFSATGFMEIILGDLKSKTNMHIVSELDADSGALLFRNRYNSAFSERTAYFKAVGGRQSYTADRMEFIGRNRNLQDPQAMSRRGLSCRTGCRLDACAAVQVVFDLYAGEEKEIIFQLGSADNNQSALNLIHRFSDSEAVHQSLLGVKEYWEASLCAVEITTPDAALNILSNGWLTYQTLACRIFARSGFYQSGGAFGFRDQLQDVLALMHSQPELTRSHILLSASHQFAEGDVQHWWHPPDGRGVRTRCSDDLLWLPYAAARYSSATGDTDILNEQIGYLECRPLQKDEDSLYDLPVRGTLRGTLYEHCVLAIRHSLVFGSRGLPLIGSGDWNDGMDRVGNKGLGESVWLAFFLYDVLIRFAAVAEICEDILFAEECRDQAALLQSNIEASSWDGAWYKRAYFDSGESLGSSVNDECRIDAIAQSWSVLSGAADPKRQKTAMASLEEHLVRKDLKLIQLLDPPFNAGGPNPGYIRGYVAGVRENGGQYSHAAVWALMAFASLGERGKVWDFFSMINPISHSSDAASIQIYKAEPYVLAADVYANQMHRGRGGWTWYTGSAGWMYQFILGSLLGIQRKAEQLMFKPCFPFTWPHVLIVYHYGGSSYRITVFQDQDISDSWWKNGETEGTGCSFTLVDDGADHEVEMRCAVNIKGTDDNEQ